MWKIPERLALTALVLSSFFAVDRALQAQSLSAGIDSAAATGEVVEIPLVLSTPDPVQGLITVIEWDSCYGDGVDLLVADGPGEPLEGADVVETSVENDHMILSALVDLDGEGKDTIPAGDAQQIGTAQIRCVCPGERQEIVVALPHRSARSLVRGGRVLNNMVVVDGRSLTLANGGLELHNGTMICNADVTPAERPEATCGDVDESGNLLPVEGAPGEDVSVCFLYRSEVTDDPLKRIQGFSLSVSYDCDLSCAEDSVDVMGTVLEEVNAEFFELHCDNDPDDGDGCELVAGMSIDVLPPFDGRTLPGTDTFRPLFCADFTISPDAQPQSDLSVEFVDGLNGRGQVPTNNLVSINNAGVPFETAACAVTVTSPGGEGNFIRGDCNFNRTVNVADAAAIISAIFIVGDLHFDPPCLDACDSDDTGELNAMDALFLLNYLFVPGSPSPPAPGPVRAGPDETLDDLTCVGGGGA